MEWASLPLETQVLVPFPFSTIRARHGQSFTLEVLFIRVKVGTHLTLEPYQEK